MEKQKFLADDNLLFGIRQDLANPESRDFARIFVEEHGRGPFLRRTVPPDLVVLLDPNTKHPVYKNTHGSTAINAGFIEPWNSGTGSVSSGQRKRERFAESFRQ